MEGLGLTPLMTTLIAFKPCSRKRASLVGMGLRLIVHSSRALV